jgi:hypothetical protein
MPIPSEDRGAGGQGEPEIDSPDSTAEVGTLRGVK